MLFETDYRKSFEDIEKEAIAEANFYFGYGRYFRKNVNENDEYFAEHLEYGKDLVRQVNAIREALRVISQELTDVDAAWNKDRADNLEEWTEEELEAHRKSYEKKRARIEDRFVGKTWRMVQLREPFEDVLWNLELKPRVRYQRRAKDDDD